MRTALWKIFTEAASEQKALKVYEQFLQQFGGGDREPVVEPYHRGGFVITFETEVPEENWNAAVVNVLAMAQRVGRQWVITGDITEELDGWSTDANIAGVTDLHVVMES